MLRRLLLFSLILLSVAGCDQISPGTNGAGVEPTATEAPAPALPTSPTPTGSPAPSESETPASPVKLLMWVPPQFDPNSGTPAGNLLQERLEAFSAQNSGLEVEVRVKAVEGPGGLLEALAAAHAAAPLALPDLVALPRPILEAAAIKGLLYPYDGLTTVMEDSGWYDYARELARLQDNTFGLPFAGDALTMLLRPESVGEVPADWEAALATGQVLAFPAADPQALFTLTQYQAAGGAVLDEQGRPLLEQEPLLEVLNFFQQAAQNGLMPYWLTQFESDEQAWEAFQQGQAPLVITWAWRYLSGETEAELLAAPLPTPDGVPFTLATGWAWALASPQPERRALSVGLAEFLVADQFLGEWSEAAGLLPPSTGALAVWQNSSRQALASQLTISARLLPSADVLSALGPALQEATVQVLKLEAEAELAAQAAVASLSFP